MAGSGVTANILIAKSIIHELIHAYLNVRHISIDNGVSLTFLDNQTLEELIHYAFDEDNDDPLDLGDSHHDFMFVHMIPVFQTILSEIITDLIPQSDINVLNNTPITDANGNFIENFDFQHFYTYLAFEGLHNTQCYTTDIASNPIELRKYQEYNRHARNSSQNCQ